MLLASLFHLLQPAYAGTNYIIDLHYQNYPEIQAKFEGYFEDADESVAGFKSKEEAELKFANYLVLNRITITKAFGEKPIATIGGDGKNTVIHQNLYVYSWVTQPTQAEVEAERLSKIKSDIEEAKAKLSLLNSNIAEAAIRVSNLNSDAEYHHPLDDKSMSDNDLFDMNDKKELRNFNKKHKKYNASVLAFGIPMVTAGVICAGIVYSEDTRVSMATGESIKSLYDGYEHYDSDGFQRKWEWSDEKKAEHKNLGIAGALLGGTGLIITTLGFAW